MSRSSSSRVARHQKVECITLRYAPTEHRRLTKKKQSPTALGGPILLGMNKEDAQQDANWGGSPSPIHQWMEALLRLAAMLLSNLANLLGMNPSRLSGECHTDATPQALPQKDCDPIEKETTLAEATGRLQTTAVRHESSLAKARSAACRGSRFSKHRDAFSLSRLRAAAAHPRDESRTLPRNPRPRISGLTAPT
jgi:hypothetical protein